MTALKNWWNGFADRHPAAAKWVREGGLFFLFSNLVTVFQYIVIQFLPAAFSAYKNIGWGWPGIPVTLFGQTFTWNAIGYDVEAGGLAYLFAYLIATFLAQCINFPLQRNITFKSHGSIPVQIFWYFVGWVAVTFVVNSINCVWVGVAGAFLPDFLYNIGTTVLTGGVSMVIFFFVFKIIFPEGEAKNREKKEA